MEIGGTLKEQKATLFTEIMTEKFSRFNRKNLVIRSKHLLISWLHSPSAVILEPKKIKYMVYV